MSATVYSLRKIRFRDGLWEGLLLSDPATAPRPEIEVRFADKPLAGVTLGNSGEPGRWSLEVPVPREALSDGVQGFVIRELRTEAVLGGFTLLAGEVLDQDLRAEVALLRAELDMLKRAFRRQHRPD